MICVTGANGFLGARVVARLQDGGHDVCGLVRRLPGYPPEVGRLASPRRSIDRRWGRRLSGTQVGGDLQIRFEGMSEPCAGLDGRSRRAISDGPAGQPERSAPERRVCKSSPSHPPSGSAPAGGPPASWRLVDYADRRSVERAMPSGAVILHVAGQTNGTESALQEANVETTRVLLSVAHEKGAQRFVFVSSAAAHLARGPYGRSKRAAEDLVRQSGLPHVIFRPTLIYGPGDSKNVAMMARVIRRCPIVPVLGGGGFRIQPVHVDDVVSALEQAVTKPAASGVYTLAGPEQITLAEMLHLIAARLGVRRLFVPVPLAPVQAAVRVIAALAPWTRLPVKQILDLDHHSAFDISAAQRDFDFHPISFRKGLLDPERSPVCAA